MIAGCAFLTYFNPESALNAQNALHEKHTLPGVSSQRSLLPSSFSFVAALVVLLLCQSRTKRAFQAGFSDYAHVERCAQLKRKIVPDRVLFYSLGLAYISGFLVGVDAVLKVAYVEFTK